MPKIKTKRSLAKRVKVSGNGKLMRQKTFSGCHHLLERKSPKRKRNFRKITSVSPSDAKRIKRLIPYAV